MQKILNQSEWLNNITLQLSQFNSTALLMYSTYWQGYIDDPRLMLIPMEDHLVHRGDGVFEAFKIVNGKIYLLKEHLDRLEFSSRSLHLEWPMSRQEVEKTLKEMIEIKKITLGGMRIFLSRGIGHYSANPYDAPKTHFHFVLLNSKMPAAEKYETGVSLGKSKIAPKPSPWANIKSCNYLPNVMMKREAVDRKMDFTIAFDESNYITECSTENLIILDQNNILCRPKLNQILSGTTMMRVFELAKKLQSAGDIAAIVERDISENDLLQAKELMIVGTTWDVLPITKYEEQQISQGKVGAVAKKMLELLRQDQT